MKSKEISSSIWLVGEKLFTLTVNLVIMLMIARSLGPESYGTLNYLLAIIALLAPIPALGLNSLITKEVLNRVSEREKIIGTSLMIRLLGSIAGLAIITTLCFVTNIANGNNTSLILLAVANIFAATGVIDFYLQAKMLNQAVVKMRVVVMLIANSMRLFGLYLNVGVEFYILVACLELILTGIGFLVLYHMNTKSLFKLAPKLSEGRYLLGKSSWLLLSGIAAIIYLKMDQVMLGLLSNQTQVGIYSVASRLSEVWYFIPTAIVVSFFPKLIKLKSSPRYLIELQKLNDVLFLLAVLVAIPTTLLAKPVIILLFGEEYQAAGIVLSIHIWAGVFIFMRTLLSKWLINENLLKFSLITQITGAMFNVLLNFWLIPLYGAIGAAVATVISYASASYFALFFHKSTLPMAKVMSKSFLLPIRLVVDGKNTYQFKS